MRHWIGVGLAIVTAAALFLGGGWGVTRMSALPAEGMGVTSPRGLSALGAMAGVGLLVGILIAVPKISPLASGLPGAVLLGWTALLSLSETMAVRLIPLKSDPAGAGFHVMLVSGVLALLGFAMIIPLFVPSRWWHDIRDEDEKGEDEDEDGGRRQRRSRRPPPPPGLLSP
jgi:hypothetical protein